MIGARVVVTLVRSPAQASRAANCAAQMFENSQASMGETVAPIANGCRRRMVFMCVHPAEKFVSRWNFVPERIAAAITNPSQVWNSNHG